MVLNRVCVHDVFRFRLKLALYVWYLNGVGRAGTSRTCKFRKEKKGWALMRSARKGVEKVKE